MIGLARIDDEQVAAFVDEAVVPRFRAEPISPLLGTLLSEVLADDLHRGAVDLLLDELLQWLHDNPDTFSDVLAERAPWWAPPRLNTVVTGRVHGEVVRWVSEIRDDPRHSARVALDSLLSGLADDLLHDADTAQRAEAFKQRVLDHPQAVATGVSLWQAFRRALQDALGDPEERCGLVCGRQ